MFYIVALMRMVLALELILIGTPLVLLASLIPISWKGAPLAGWVTTLLARIFLRIFNIKLICPNPERIKQHRGYIFPNHDSYLDIVLPVAIAPMRFVAAIEVKRKPLIAQMANAIKVIYVDRTNRDTRRRTRQQLAGIADTPPIVLYPEGILDGTPGISPFRYGAFEMAKYSGMPFLPVAIVYDDFWTARWKHELLLLAIWRLAKKPRLEAKMIALDPVQPGPNDDPHQLAIQAQEQVLAALRHYGNDAYKMATLSADKPRKPDL